LSSRSTSKWGPTRHSAARRTMKRAEIGAGGQPGADR
jgi:hypothetical protein